MCGRIFVSAPAAAAAEQASVAQPTLPQPDVAPDGARCARCARAAHTHTTLAATLWTSNAALAWRAAEHAARGSPAHGSAAATRAI